MLRFLVLSALVACAFGNVVLPRTLPLPDGRIVGGVDTTIEEFPYQVSLRLLGSHSCGGSILNERWVVTAAHCCSYAASWYTVEFGSTNKGSGTKVNVEQIIRHEGYNSATVDNDVCLVKLADSIPETKASQRIQLATREASANDVAVVTGWGALKENGSSPTKLQKVEVLIDTRSRCNTAYAAYGGITDGMVCASVPNGGKDACQGDSGGPLVINGELAGIVSWGVGCAQANYPGVYAYVYRYVSWIEAAIRNN